MMWRLRDLPELQHLSPDDRKRLLRKHAGRGVEVNLLIQSAARALALVVVAFIVVSLLLNIDLFTASPSIPPGPGAAPPAATAGSSALPTLVVVMLVVVAWLAATAGFYLVYMIQIRGQLRIALIDHLKQGGELPVCVRCGYGFEPPVPVTCPECGAPAG